MSSLKNMHRTGYMRNQERGESKYVKGLHIEIEDGSICIGMEGYNPNNLAHMEHRHTKEGGISEEDIDAVCKHLKEMFIDLASRPQVKDMFDRTVNIFVNEKPS